MKTQDFSRRDFLQRAALSIGALGAGSALMLHAADSKLISIVTHRADLLAATPPVTWALQELTRAIEQRGITVRRYESLEGAPKSDFYIVAAGCDSPQPSEKLKQAAVSVSHVPESLALAPWTHRGTPALFACARDSRGLMYALLELADQVQHADNPIEALQAQKAIAEQPFNAVRSIGRLFVSDVEDKPWFNDREMWRAYFSMLAAQRFNRFHLALGISYDFLQHVTDSYFVFAYPFLLSVPGYKVRAVNLSDDERDRNLETLQFISRQAVAYGIDFQLGIWTHGYQWTDSPNANYLTEGLTPENHAAYCRDALAALLHACPDISGVTLRTHGESGVHEGSYDFWKTVFQGVPQSGRKVEIDLHTKGLNQTILDSALATGMPVKLSPKYWAEHMGLPYHQAAIRGLEMPRPEANNQGFFALSTGERIFTRYGYADFLKEDRPYSVMTRIWPGTHRFLLWGDPVSTAAHSRAFRFCGMNGAELFEPLSFKGRRGSGLPGGRCAYADTSLTPHWDWEKYLYTYRQWGRLLYNPNPDADPDTWRRYLRAHFNAKAPAVESALASATRILPLVTTAHMPSAANDTYGPEFYTNQPIVDPAKSAPYGDTPAPKVFGNTSPLDPQLFSRIGDFADELLKGERSGKYSPVEVAQWLEDLSQNAASALAEAGGETEKSAGPEFRRIAIDATIQIGLGRFFAAKLRSGTLYAIHGRSGSRAALEEALKQYRRAREVWSQFAEEAKSVYVPDITIGPRRDQRGHWLDRLPAIDDDIADMAKRLESLPTGVDQPASVRSVIQQALGSPLRNPIACSHTPPSRFAAGKDLDLVLSFKQPVDLTVARLYYRHVNQAERYESAELQPHGKEFQGRIPGSYLDPTYPLQYYFELRQGKENAWLYPGFNADLTNQPYFIVRRG
jgi:hypothetical protein